jgi:Domain of unknown function (DUF6438)
MVMRGSEMRELVMLWSIILTFVGCLTTIPALCKNRVVMDEFSLERTECFGPCPVYKVTIRLDGSVRYVGKKNVQRIGTYTGNAIPSAVKKN